MKLAILYRATYNYEEKASLSPHLVRIFPRLDLSLKIERTKFSTHETADVQYRRDLYDNLIAYCFFPQAIQELSFDLDLEIEIAEKNPFHFLLDAHALHIPFVYTATEASVLSPFLVGAGQAGTLPASLKMSAKRPTIEALVTMNQWLFDNIEYERREEGDAYPADYTLKTQKGSCRDTSVLFLDVLRQNGIAARVVSGFVWEDEFPEEGAARSVNAMHAWVEAYLPGAGWVGMDPTNGAFADHHFIPTAVGLQPPDIAPILGTYYGHKTIKSSLETSLQIQPR
jgi:transglutaminase-like putative cysteine protease